jgi:hypothetical protein
MQNANPYPAYPFIFSRLAGQWLVRPEKIKGEKIHLRPQPGAPLVPRLPRAGMRRPLRGGPKASRDDQ